MELERISGLLEVKQKSVTELKSRIQEQETLSAEFISMKFKAARSNQAIELLGGAEFEACPACGTEIEKPKEANRCVLCKSDLRNAPTQTGFDASAIELDLTERIDDLKRSIGRLKRALNKQSKSLDEFRADRNAVLARIDKEKRSVESEYMKRALRTEGRLGEVRERIRVLERIKQMPEDVERKRAETAEIATEVERIEREIDEEQERFFEGRRNVDHLESNLGMIMRAIRFPEITDEDTIVMNRRDWFPYVYLSGDPERAWTFSDAGSGGKMVLFKISFALALHLTAAQRGLPLPRFLLIDSTMKNITPDVNRYVFESFYRELYRLLENELSEWQVVLIDQTYNPPDERTVGFVSRKFTTSEEEFPPLISYYHGH